MRDEIDFVITWVDGSDPQWRKEKKYYEDLEHINFQKDDANTECRYRNDGLLKYWFRGVEKFAPWVNQIHFVTCGQKPEWLNTAHPKLHLVNHKDYIPPQYLPTFCSNVIELNLHRIESLSEKFVIFNDDIFLLQPLEPIFYFRNGLPVLDTDLTHSTLVGYNNWSRVLFNNYCIVRMSLHDMVSNWILSKPILSYMTSSTIRLNRILVS